MSEIYTHDEKEEVPVVWFLPAGKTRMPVTVSVFSEHYFLTETAALDALRKHAKEQEAKWYALIRQIDARVDEIETAEVGEENHGS